MFSEIDRWCPVVMLRDELGHNLNADCRSDASDT